jgi:integrase/recombinase XerD
MTRTRDEPECSGDMNSIIGNCEFKDCAYIRRPVTPHVRRHTFSVTAIQKVISLPALQRLLGHDHLATTEIYLNLSPEEVVREFREKW